MTLIQESYLQNLLNECDSLAQGQQKESQQAASQRLTEIYDCLIKNIRQAFHTYSLDVFVRFSELAVQIQNKFALAQQIMTLFFQRIQNPSQFYIRALFVNSKIIAYNGHKNNKKGQQMIQILKLAIAEISKALDLIAGPNDPNPPKGKDSKGAPQQSNKSKYSFLVYNASTCLYKITRFMLRQYWQKNFTQIFERIYKLFQQLDEPDHNWRCRFSLILFQCLYQSQKKPDAFKVLDALWERTKNKNCDFQDSLFRLRVHLSKQNNALVAIIKKDIQGQDPNGWKILEVLQRIKSGGVPEAQIEKQLMGVVNQISLGVLSTNQQNTSNLLTPIMQERLAQAGRISLKFNIITIANSITTFLSKARQPNQKAMVLNQYNKAELLIKKKGDFIDKKTGMMMNAAQIKNMEVQYRKEALKILEKVMIINKKLNKPELIYEGAILIWNISLPFMCSQYQSAIVKAFQISCSLLQQIDSIDHDLRTKMHLELAKIYLQNQLMFPEVQKNIMKAIKLDHSIPLNKISHKFDAQEDPGLYYRPYQRYLNDFHCRIMLKTLLNLAPSELDTVTLDLWNVIEQKSQTTRIDILQKCLRALLTLEQKPYVLDQSALLVDQEIKNEKIQYERNKLKDYKRKKLLSAQVAELAFEWELNDFAKKACDYVLADTWQVKNSAQLIIAQSKCCYFMGQIKIDQLNQEGFEIPFEQAIRTRQQQQNEPLSSQVKQSVKNKKKLLFETYSRGLKLAESIQKHWLIFNGAIYLWNNFIHIFRNPINDSKLHPDLCQLLKLFFQAMKNSLKQIQQKQIVYYDLDSKIQTFANIGLIYARLMETQKQSEQVSKICQALLITQLSPHTRKLINSIKARVSNAKGGVAAGKTDPKKGAAGSVPQKTGGNNDTFLFQIFSQLEIIQNSTNKSQTENLIKKCFESLESWSPKQKDETELQLHAQLWARLARLAINEQNTGMYKYGLRCVSYSLSLLGQNTDYNSIHANRLRWYSLAEFLYSQCLLKIVNPQTQQKQNCQKLLFTALSHAVQAAFKGYKSNINALVVDASKQVWNICNKLQHSQANRVKLLQPIKTTLYYLKEMKEQNQVDLVLLLSQLYFRTAFQNNSFVEGEQLADSLFGIVPKSFQKSIWQAKMVFMSKQGKNQLQAISNMKEADPSLQAKLWVKLARAATNSSKQHAAYNKAIDILKKENSVQIVQVLIQYSQWQLRVGKEKLQTVVSTLLLASDYLIDIQFGDQQQQEDDGDQGTVFSRSTRGKKSQGSKSVKSSLKQQKSKKPIQKKGPISGKSKGGSNISRMNRSRTAKTIKSKNVKSIFSQKQQDPNPDTLNCSHYERLFRIHTTLSLLATNVTDKIRYALDAKQFIFRIIQLSMKSINDMQQNAAKFSQKEQIQTQVKKIALPTTIQGWALFQLPKQYLDKIKNTQDFNIMGNYALDKPELTYTYLRHLIQTFCSYGLTFHTFPLLFFQKFLSKQIIGNENLFNLSQLQTIQCLYKINYYQKYPEQWAKISFNKYILTDAQKKKQLTKTYERKVSYKPQSQLFEENPGPNLIKAYTSPDCWFQLGKVLLEFGQIYKCKLFLTQSLKHFEILGMNQKIGENNLYLGFISDIEGQSKKAIQLALRGNKFCKSTQNVQKMSRFVFQILSRVKKFDDIKTFLKKISSVIEEILKEIIDEIRETCSFQSEIVQLRNILCSIQIVNLSVLFDETLDESVNNDPQPFIERIAKLQDISNKEPLWTYHQYKLFYDICFKIFRYYQQGEQKIQFGPNLFEKLFNLVLKIQKNIVELLKYTVLGPNSQNLVNQLTQLHRDYHFLIVSGYVVLDSLGDKKIYEDRQQIDVVNDLGSNNLSINKYMATLDMEIKKKISPIQTNLEPLEAAYAILANLKSKIPVQFYQYVIWAAESLRIATLRAISKNQLNNVWTKSSQIKGQQSLAIASLEAFLAFEDIQNRANQFLDNNNCYVYSSRAYISMIENSGLQNPEKYFQSLVKLQHAQYSSIVIDNVKKYIQKNNRFLSILRLNEKINLTKQKMVQMLKNDKIYTAVTNVPTFEECLSFLPKNSITIVIQMNRSKSEIYLAAYIPPKQEDQSKSPTISCLKKQISKAQLRTYINLKKQLHKIKKNMSLTPIEDENRQNTFINEKQEALINLKNKLEQLSSWWTASINQLINKAKEQPIKQQVNPKDKKPPVKDQKKKGGKEQVASYQSPLGTTPSGIENVTLLLDSFLYGLPFQQLNVFEKTPSLSRDLSFFYYCRKLKQLGFKPELNNSNGFGIDKGRYIAYDFKQDSANFKQILQQITKVSPNLKFQGLDSINRRPSLGDYQKYITQGGFLQIYGPINFLNHITFASLAQMLGNNKVKLFIITDHLNYRKSILNKFIEIHDQGLASVNLENQQIALSCIMSMLDCTFIKNRWPATPAKIAQQMNRVYTSLGSSYYIGSISHRQKVGQEAQSSDIEPCQKKITQSLYYRMLNVVNGPGVLRI